VPSCSPITNTTACPRSVVTVNTRHLFRARTRGSPRLFCSSLSRHMACTCRIRKLKCFRADTQPTMIVELIRSGPAVPCRKHHFRSLPGVRSLLARSDRHIKLTDNRFTLCRFRLSIDWPISWVKTTCRRLASLAISLVYGKQRKLTRGRLPHLVKHKCNVGAISDTTFHSTWYILGCVQPKRGQVCES
jgi:hypothetical protein